VTRRRDLQSRDVIRRQLDIQLIVEADPYQGYAIPDSTFEFYMQVVA